MFDFSLTHLANATLLSNLTALVARDRANTAQLLAHLAEVDSRRLYAPAGYPSMYDYCVHALHLSEDAAYKRIRVARAARRFPAIFRAVTEGGLHLSAVVLLTPYLTQAIADDLLSAAEGKTKSEIEMLLAQRFPRPDVPPHVLALSSPPSTVPTDELAPGPVGALVPNQLSTESVRAVVSDSLAPGPVEAPITDHPSPATVPPPAPRPRVTPLAPGRFGVQLTIGQSTHDKLQRAKELLGHRLPSGDLEKVLDLALDALIQQLEKRKLAATERPRRAEWEAKGKRYIPAHVRRAVWKRDGERCTFVSDTGKRCDGRGGLEFDHVQEAARGGWATVGNIRLRCRTHNQYGAECTFGAEFMSAKRERARRVANERARTKACSVVDARGAETRSPPA